MLGDVRRYDPSPPQMEEVDPLKFPLKLASLEVDDTKKGWDRFKVSLSNDVRKRHLDDPVNSQQWKDLILDFDKKNLTYSHQVLGL